MPNAPTAATHESAPSGQATGLAPAPTLGAGFLGFVVGAVALYSVLRRARKEAQDGEREG
jgi:hypothetical protein